MHRAQQALVNLGFAVEVNEIANLSSDELGEAGYSSWFAGGRGVGADPQETTSNLLPLRSSLDGVVVDRKAVAGEVVDSKRRCLMWPILRGCG